MNNHNSLPVVQSLWIGGRMSVMEQLCICSFLRNGHEFILYTYGNIKNVPNGTTIKDASEIISPDKIFKYKDRDTYAGFSNIFRYKLLLEKGNYWVDFDVVCLKPFINSDDYVFARARSIESCVIKTPPGSEIMDYCYEVSKNKNPQELEWGEIGPDLLRDSIKRFGLQKYVAKAEIFCPIDWPEWERCISGSLIISWIELAKMAIFKTKAVHLWNEMWRQKGIDKNSQFPKRSLYERLKRRYNITK